MPETKLTMNPRVRSVQIGITEPRTIEIYPLSYRDQERLSEVIQRALTMFAEASDAEQQVADFVAALFILFKENINQIIRMVTPRVNHDEVDILAEIDNEQLFEIAKIIYEVNYSFLYEMAQKWLKKAEKLPGSQTSIPSLRKSAEDMAIHPMSSSQNPS